MNEGGDFDKLGRGCIWRGEIVPCIAQNHVFAVRPRNVLSVWLNAITSSAYAQFYFKSRSKQSTNLASISSANLMELPVVLPPNEEQSAIVGFLDHETSKIDALIVEQRRLIELLKEKRQAVISHAVTKGLNPHAPMKPSGIEWLGDVPAHWSVGALRYYATFATGSTPDRNNAAFWDGGIAWVKTGEINYAGISATEETISEAGLESSSCSIAPAGTLLMALYGQGVTRGRVAILEIPAAFNQACVAIFPDKRLNSSFLRSFFVFAYSFIRDIGNETTQMNMNVEFVRRIPLVMPPASEQEMITRHVQRETERFETLMAEAQRAVDLLQERRTALISAAVTGKIDVRGSIATEAA
jgi:type I restriction enzyme S subunit